MNNENRRITFDAHRLFISRHGLLQRSGVLRDREEVRQVRVSEDRPRCTVTGVQLDSLKRLLVLKIFFAGFTHLTTFVKTYFNNGTLQQCYTNQQDSNPRPFDPESSA